MKASDTSDRSKAIYALASSWASIDGKLESFAKDIPDSLDGTKDGYLIEAEEMLSRLEKRGFSIIRVQSHPHSVAQEEKADING